MGVRRRLPVSRHRQPSDKLVLYSMLTWFSVFGSPQLQHRVGRPSRDVDYDHVLSNIPRSHFEKFWIPSQSSTGATGDEEPQTHQSLIEEINDENDEVFWTYHAYPQPPQPPLIPPQQQQSKPRYEEGRGLNSPLYDQFVGEDQTLTNSTNVTTEVELDGGNTTDGNETSDSIVYTTSEEPQQNSTAYQPLRIRAILTESTGNGNLLTRPQRDALFRRMLSPALLSWSSALRVDPVVGNLTVDVNQLVDGETCGPGVDSGLPSVQVPLQHLVTGIPDTDMIVYVSLAFVAPPTTDSATNSPAEDEEDDVNVARPQWWGRHVEEKPELTSDGLLDAPISNVTANYTRINGTKPENDIIDNENENNNNTLGESLNETVSNIGSDNATSQVSCSGDYLAAASYCSTDQYDRPTAALLHICIDEDFFSAQKQDRNIMTLMHELGHALGFNSLSMAHFRRRDGTPYTPRVNGEVPEVEIECTGPKAERRSARVALPSEEILQFREVRGGVRVAELVTPSTVQVVRNQFNCQRLTGAELESGGVLPLAIEDGVYGCIGDHWERRLFSSDLMNPVVDELDYSPWISTLTLAYFADSGWYQVDLSNAQVANGWGRGTGCNFASDTCIGKDGHVPPQNAPFFCDEIPSPDAQAVAKNIHGCTPDLTRKAVCSIGQYDLDLPWEYQYFQDKYGSDVGGNDPFMDFCPVYVGFEDGVCSDAGNARILRASDIETFGQRNSRCLVGKNIGSANGKTALCLPIACVVEDKSFRINVDRVWHVCKEADQEITSGEITVICPDPRRICPTFYCPYDCLGTGGICDYDSGECLCEYVGIAIDGSSEWRPCGSVPITEPSDQDNTGPFLRPSQPNSGGPMLPHPDSPLSDYYVPTTRSLSQSEIDTVDKVVLGLAIGAGCIGITLIIFFLWALIRKRAEDQTGWFRPGVDPENDNAPVSRSRNKDKMIASVLVNMRMHHNTGPSQDGSIADTDERLTESEAASGPPSEALSDISCLHSDTMSDLDVTLDQPPPPFEDNDDDPTLLANGLPQVIRRRRF